MLGDRHEGRCTSTGGNRRGIRSGAAHRGAEPVLAVRHVAVALALALAAGATSAAPGFTYRLVRDFPATTNNDPRLAIVPEEALCNFAFNELGQAVYTASRIEFSTNPQATTTSLYFWDGTSEQLVYRDTGPRDGIHVPDFGGCPGYGIGLNDSGLIAVPALTSPGNVPGIMYFRPGLGHVGTVEDPDRSPAFWSRANLSSAGRVAYVGGVSPAVGVSCFRIGTLGLGTPATPESRICNTSGELLFLAGFGGGIVNEPGQAAILVARRVGSAYATSLLDYDGTGVSRLTDLGLLEGWFVHSAVPGFNAAGFASVVTDGPLPLNHPASVFRVALVSPDRQSVSILTDGSIFTRDPHTGRAGTWLNDLNQVAFAVTDLDPGNPNVSRQGLWLVDAAREPLAVLLGGYEPFPFGGQAASAVFLWTDSYPGGRGDLLVSNGGDVMFSATYVPAGAPTSTLRHGIFVAHPEPGLTPSSPVLPAPGDALPIGWRFVAPCASFRNAAFPLPGSAPARPRTCWVDPAFASGYTFTAEPGSAAFASVLVPAPLPGGDADFTLEVEGITFPLRAGEVFDLTTVAQTGVRSFRITGIDLAEALSPSNPAAFVTGLTWAGDPTAPNDFTMVPIVDSDGDGVEDDVDACPGTPAGAPVDAVGCPLPPPDADGDGVPDATDACPGTAPGTAVDAAGCSASQRDSDGDGVQDDVDTCPGTPAGTPVNAVGCPLPPPDADGDGVPDANDSCPGTAPGAAVDAAGCSASQRDSDGDGVKDDVDACAGTPAGTPVDAIGCPVNSTGRTCDADRDGDVDWRDIKAIARALGQMATGPADPRDANRNGRIDLKDVLICSAKCDRWLCASP